MPDIDDGGFNRRETGGYAPKEQHYFECEKTEECCDDMDRNDVEACDCKDCVAYIEFMTDAEESMEEDRKWWLHTAPRDEDGEPIILEGDPFFGD